jgi:hypothetical protein
MSKPVGERTSFEDLIITQSTRCVLMEDTKWSTTTHRDFKCWEVLSHLEHMHSAEKRRPGSTGRNYVNITVCDQNNFLGSEKCQTFAHVSMEKAIQIMKSRKPPETPEPFLNPFIAIF